MNLSVAGGELNATEGYLGNEAATTHLGVSSGSEGQREQNGRAPASSPEVARGNLAAAAQDPLGPP